jgi:hypothetical protein
MRECDVGVRRVDRKPIKMCNLKHAWLQQNAPQVGRVCLPNLAIFFFLIPNCIPRSSPTTIFFFKRMEGVENVTRIP